MWIWLWDLFIEAQKTHWPYCNSKRALAIPCKAEEVFQASFSPPHPQDTPTYQCTVIHKHATPLTVSTEPHAKYAWPSMLLWALVCRWCGYYRRIRGILWSCTLFFVCVPDYLRGVVRHLQDLLTVHKNIQLEVLTGGYRSRSSKCPRLMNSRLKIHSLVALYHVLRPKAGKSPARRFINFW